MLGEAAPCKTSNAARSERNISSVAGRIHCPAHIRRRERTDSESGRGILGWSLSSQRQIKKSHGDQWYAGFHRDWVLLLWGRTRENPPCVSLK
jgi:hypothetical protein